MEQKNIHDSSEFVVGCPNSDHIPEMTEFFRKQMQLTIEQGYTQEDIDWNITEHHTEELFRNHVGNPSIYLMTVEFGGKIIGYLEARRKDEDKSRIHIWWVLVDTEFQGKGIGRQLYGKLENFVRNSEELTTISAGVLVKNNASIQFHESLGYSVETKNDYEIVFVKKF